MGCNVAVSSQHHRCSRNLPGGHVKARGYSLLAAQLVPHGDARLVTFQIIAKLEKEPRPQLLIVRYALHQPLPASVYNSAEIDASKIIFARDHGPCGNQELLHYYASRQKWLLKVDGFNYRPTPYPEDQSCVG